MTAQFWKGLLMTLMGIVVVYFSTTPIEWSIMIITLVGTALVYFGKNAFVALKSRTKAGSLDLKNIISALLIAIGTGIIDAIGMIVIDGKIVWLLLGKIVLGVTFTYLGGTLLGGPNSPVKTKLFVT